MNVVLDTNVLLVSLPSRSPFHLIYSSLLQKTLTAFVRNEILTEYEEQISIRLGFQRSDLQIRELLNLPNFRRIEVYYNWQLIEADPDDNKFADCAIACGADYLVTNDRHYQILRQIAFPKVEIIRAEEFLEILNNSAKTAL